MNNKTLRNIREFFFRMIILGLDCNNNKGNIKNLSIFIFFFPLKNIGNKELLDVGPMVPFTLAKTRSRIFFSFF